MNSTARRLVAYVIDLMLPILLIWLIRIYRVPEPSAAQVEVLFNSVAAAYLLLRDIAGASIGKWALGLRVINVDGGAAGISARILRNVTLALGPFATAVLPDTGMGTVGGGAAGLVMFVEAVFLWQGGQRLGDRIAGTRVDRRSTV